MSAGSRTLLAILAGLGVAAAADAQDRPRVEVILPAAQSVGREPPIVRSERLLADARVRDLLTSGFPARISYTLERWATKRWFDDLRASFEWSALVRHDPLSGMYRVYRIRGPTALLVGEYATLTSADSALGAPVRTGITPPNSGERSYYSLQVDVEMLSVSDLNELERWLRGELRPAVRGGRNPGTVLERGARTLLVRVLGGERRRYVARSERFAP